MKPTVLAGISAVVIQATAGLALAQQQRLFVDWINSTAGICTGNTGNCTINQFGGPTSVEISDSNCFAFCTKRINVYPNTPGDGVFTIDRLDVDGGSALEPFEIVLGEDVVIVPDAAPNGVAGSWRGLTLITSAPDSIFYGGCSGSLLGGISGIDKIARFDCDGAIAGAISTLEGINGRGVIIECGSVSGNGSINVDKLERLSVNGSCAGNITADHLTLEIDISGSQTGGAIEGIDLDGTITAGGALRRVRITNASGALRGDVTAQTLGVVDGQSLPPINVSSLEASVFIGQDVLLPVSVGAWPGPGELFTIGRTLEERPSGGIDQGNRMIVIRDPDPEDSEVASELTNQIIINAGNNTPMSDISEFWQGGVSINYPGSSYLGMDTNAPAQDEVLIGPEQVPPYESPYYTAVSSELGGGSIGLAPFNFHQRESDPPAGESRDCDPYQTEQLLLGPLDERNSVLIRHYGPVYVSGSGPHFRVEFRPRWFPSVWEDKTDLFEVDTSSGKTATSSNTLSRDVYIKPSASNHGDFKVAGYWRIRPLAGKVKCAHVTDSPDVLWDSSVVSGDLGSTSGTQYSWYAFGVQTYLAMGGSAPIFEGDQVNASDIAAWAVEPFETNADGGTDAQDLADMVEAYDP
ncbi:MAG: polymer-forming cytoskeletal protein [Phycisphaerales bacterium]